MMTKNLRTKTNKGSDPPAKQLSLEKAPDATKKTMPASESYVYLTKGEFIYMAVAGMVIPPYWLPMAGLVRTSDISARLRTNLPIHTSVQTRDSIQAELGSGMFEHDYTVRLSFDWPHIGSNLSDSPLLELDGQKKGSRQLSLRVKNPIPLFQFKKLAVETEEQLNDLFRHTGLSKLDVSFLQPDFDAGFYATTARVEQADDQSNLRTDMVPDKKEGDIVKYYSRIAGSFLGILATSETQAGNGLTLGVHPGALALFGDATAHANMAIKVPDQKSLIGFINDQLTKNQFRVSADLNVIDPFPNPLKSWAKVLRAELYKNFDSEKNHENIVRSSNENLDTLAYTTGLRILLHSTSATGTNEILDEFEGNILKEFDNGTKEDIASRHEEVTEIMDGIRKAIKGRVRWKDLKDKGHPAFRAFGLVANRSKSSESSDYENFQEQLAKLKLEKQEVQMATSLWGMMRGIPAIDISIKNNGLWKWYAHLTASGLLGIPLNPEAIYKESLQSELASGPYEVFEHPDGVKIPIKVPDTMDQLRHRFLKDWRRPASSTKERIEEILVNCHGLPRQYIEYEIKTSGEIHTRITNVRGGARMRLYTESDHSFHRKIRDWAAFCKSATSPGFLETLLSDDDVKALLAL